MRNQRHKHRPCRPAVGFTLFEFVIVICIIAILASVLMGKIQTTAEIAERTSMETTANEIKSALLLEFANNIMRNTRNKIPAMVETNPVDWLAQKPSNYLGEFKEAPTDPEQTGNWYYDKSNHLLVYLVRRGEDFAPDSSGAKRVRYRIKIIYDTEQPKVVVGMLLVPTEPYKWV